MYGKKDGAGGSLFCVCTGAGRYKAFHFALVCAAASGAKYFRRGKRSQNVQCFS